ncbi:MAG: ABC transporter substrate-binding protein [Armatimonadetes bacterium]|nr:ABC transporter substrate-binding protein [Armatimonadota bacterium]
MTATTELRLAYSPDADDAFMFRAAIEGLIDTEGLRFLPVTSDTQQLNDMADRGEVDISAVSVAAYPYFADRFVMFGHGGSVGMGYGPVIVARQSFPIQELNTKLIATPGARTTAHLITRLIAPHARMTTVPITPYEAIFEAIDACGVGAGIIIHEGRLTYQQHGLKNIVDLGEWWMEQTGLPLPLGANVIRRGVGSEVIARASRVLQRSIRWARDHRDQMIQFLITHIHRPDEVATPELLDRYLAMYANEETHEYSAASRQAVQLIFDRGFEAGLLPKRVVAEFV